MPINTTAEYSDVSYDYILAEEFQEEARPKNVASRLMNEYNIEGLPAGALKLVRMDDPGRAGSATEGVPYNVLTSLGHSAITPAPTEFAIAQTLVTNDAVETRVPGMSSVAVLMADGSTDQKVAALRPEASILARSCFEAHEFESTQLYTGVTRSKGPTSAGDPLTVVHFEDALYTLESGETLPHEDIVANCTVAQKYDLAADARALTGTPFTQDLATIIKFMPDLSRVGLKGALLGVPIFQMSPEVEQRSGDGADGCLFLRGSGAPEMGGGGKYGAFAFVQGRRLYTVVDARQRERGSELQVNWKGEHITRRDEWACRLTSRHSR